MLSSLFVELLFAGEHAYRARSRWSLFRRMFPTLPSSGNIPGQVWLVFVNLQPLDERLWSIILTLNERLAGQIVHANHFGRFEFEVVDAPTAWMNPASGEALLDDLRGHVQVQHQVYLINSIQGLSLSQCSGETTQQPALLAEIFQLVKGHSGHDVVRDELPLVHENLGEHTDLCVPQHVFSDQVPAGELFQPGVFGDAQSQGVLAGVPGAGDHRVQEPPRRPHGCWARPGYRQLGPRLGPCALCKLRARRRAPGPWAAGAAQCSKEATPQCKPGLHSDQEHVRNLEDGAKKSPFSPCRRKDGK